MIGFYIFMTCIIGGCVVGGLIVLWTIYCLLRLLTRSAFPKRES